MWNPWSKREQRKPSVIPREVIDCLDHPGQWTQAMDEVITNGEVKNYFSLEIPILPGTDKRDALGALVIVGNYLYHNPGS